MISDNIRKSIFSIPTRSVYFVWIFFLLGAPNVHAQMEAWEASLIEDGTYLAICEDDKFLKVGSLTFDSCVAKARNYAKQCWVHLNSVIEAGKELSGGTGYHRSKQANTNIVWLFSRCIQASVLLPHTVPSDKIQLEQAEPLRIGGAELGGLEDVAKESASIYANIQRTLIAMQEKLTATGYEAVFPIGRGKVSAISRENDILTNDQPDDPEMWTNLFSISHLKSAEKIGSEYHFKYAPAISTSAHTFDITFIRSPSDTLEVCRPKYAEVSCGSCDVHIEDRVVARITWHSNEIAREAEDVDASNIDDLNFQDIENSDVMKCWFEGMKELGYDDSELGPWNKVDK